MQFRHVCTMIGAVCVGLALPLCAAELPSLENYDIRLTDEKTAVTEIERHRAEHGLQGTEALDVDQQMQSARQGFFDAVPAFHVLDSVETGAPEVIGVARGAVRLTAPSDDPREAIARRFAEENSWLFGLSPAQAAELKIDADYTNPAGNISWVRLKQQIGGLDVFRGFVTFALTPAGEIARTTGQLAAGVPDAFIPRSPELTAAEGVAAGAAAIGVELSSGDLEIVSGLPEGPRVVFDRGPFARGIEAELIYFPLDRGVVELAWSMTLWGAVDSYMVIVSAEEGFLLFRKNITEYDTYNYEIYPSDSPAPLTPGPTDPGFGTQGALVPRFLAAIESQAANGDPWLPAGLTDPQKVTDGNNVEAGLDISSPDGVDAPVPASSPASNTFSYSFNPAPGNPAPGDSPTLPDYRNGSVVNLFYWSNRFHDLTYDLGFTEQAFNFQTDNYGRGGAGADRISAEAQDSSGTNNANFSTPADGGRGRMQMYVWTSPTPDRDGSLDADIVIHELTHGLSNRLHGNSSGLGSNLSRGMGEGWSDFYAHSLLSEPADPINGIYTIGGYSTINLPSLGAANYYYGIRGFPKAVMGFTGGPGNLPYNPLTFADIDQTQFVTDDGAFPRLAAGHISNTADQVHAAGEVWSTALWEARGFLINRLGHTVGNQTMLQLVTDGMKLDPVNPDFLDARDSILAADCIAYSGANEVDLWSGFATRGMGYSAEVLVAGSGGSTRVVEAFDGVSAVPMGETLLQSASCTEVGSGGTPPNPGETVVFSVELINPFCGTIVTGVSARIASGSSVSFGDLAPGQTATRDLAYAIPLLGTCGDLLTLDVHISSSIGNSTEQIDLQVGPTAINETTFTNPAVIDIPAGQPASTSGPATPYPSTIAVSGITEPVLGVTVTVNQLSHEWVSDVDILLESPSGQTVVVLSDAWSGSNDPPVVATLKFEDAAIDTPPTSGLPPASGNFKPVNHGTGDPFDPPAPAGPHGDPPLSAFAGVNANGDWKLWIDDDAGSDPGQMLGGWSIGILTQGNVSCTSCLVGVLFYDDFETGGTGMWTLTND